MARFHFSDKTGEASECKAQKDNCPFREVSSHPNSLEEAEAERDRFMEKQHGLVKSVYKGTKDQSALGHMKPEMKRKIMADAAEGKNGLNSQVVGRVFSKDNDELVRRDVAENIKSQKLLRQMSDDESPRVRQHIAQSTNNREVLNKLMNDPDSKTRNLAMANAKAPVRAKKATMEKLKNERSERAKRSRDQEDQT